MTHVARLIYGMAGAPPIEGAIAKQIKNQPGVCCICGETEEQTALADRALGANFTDRRMFTRPDSDRVCQSCVAVCSGKPPRTFRMWSIVATPGRALPDSAEKAAVWIGNHKGLCLTSKANTQPVIDTLLDPPDTDWVVSVADSGQKHVLPYATINRGKTGIIRFETVDIPYQQSEFQHVFTNTLELRRLGTPAENILEGTPKYLKTRDQMTAWKTHRDRLKPYLKTPLLQLTLWAITKGITDNDKY